MRHSAVSLPRAPGLSAPAAVRVRQRVDAVLGVAAGVAAQWLLAASLAPSASKAVETPSVVRIRVAQAPRDLVKRNSAPAGVLPLNVKKPVPAPPRRNRTPQFSAGVSAPPTPPLDASAPLPGEMQSAPPRFGDLPSSSMVLALEIDDTGQVVAARIARPSSTPLQDLSIVALALGRHWPGPPAAPGQVRKVQFTVNYPPPSLNQLP